MNIFSIKLISLLAVFLVTALVGCTQFTKYNNKNIQQSPSVLAEALCAGIFLAVGLMHMLVDAIKQFSQLHFHFPIAIMIATIIILGLALLEYFSKQIPTYKCFTDNRFIIIATIILSIHSLIEGAALGLTDDKAIAIMIFIAIIAHKGAAAFALAIRINKSKIRRTIKIFIYTIFALMTPVGIFLGDIVNFISGFYPILDSIFLSIAAGTFIFLGLHDLKHAVIVNHSLAIKYISFVFIGFGFMAIVGIWV